LDGLDALRNIMKDRKNRRMAVLEPTPPSEEEENTLADDSIKTAKFFVDYFKNSNVHAELAAEELVFTDKYEAALALQKQGPIEPKSA